MSFSCNYKKRSAFIRKTATLILSAFAASVVYAQVEDYQMASSDGEFFMEVYREKAVVNVVFKLNDAQHVANVKVEKSNGTAVTYTMCGYYGLKEQNKTAIITKRDNYPYGANEDCYYRLRIVFTDGSEKIYPPVRLPAVGTEASFADRQR